MDDEELTGQDYYLDGVQDTKDALARLFTRINRNHDQKTFSPNQIVQIINSITDGYEPRRLDS